MNEKLVSISTNLKQTVETKIEELEEQSKDLEDMLTEKVNNDIDEKFNEFNEKLGKLDD